MKLSESIEILELVRQYWPHGNMSDALAEAYLQHMIPFDFEGMKVVLDSLIDTEDFRPSIAKLRKRYYALSGVGHMDGAWDQLRRIVQTGEIDPEWHKQPGLDPIGVAALQNHGGMPRYRYTDDSAAFRREWEKTYRRMLESEFIRPVLVIEQLQEGPVSMLDTGGKPEAISAQSVIE